MGPQSRVPLAEVEGVAVRGAWGSTGLEGRLRETVAALPMQWVLAKESFMFKQPRGGGSGASTTNSKVYLNK